MAITLCWSFPEGGITLVLPDAQIELSDLWSREVRLRQFNEMVARVLLRLVLKLGIKAHYIFIFFYHHLIWFNF